MMWADLKFPPINLWSVPKNGAAVDIVVCRSVFPTKKVKIDLLYLDEKQRLFDKMMKTVRKR